MYIQGSLYKIIKFVSNKYCRPEDSRITTFKVLKGKTINQEYTMQQNCSLKMEEKLRLSKSLSEGVYHHWTCHTRMLKEVLQVEIKGCYRAMEIKSSLVKVNMWTNTENYIIVIFSHIYPLLILVQNLKDKSIKSNYKSMLMDPKYIKYNL